MWGLLVLFGLISQFKMPYFVGVMLILFALVFEHWLARRRSLNWINMAFFRLNALISLIFLAVTVASVAFTPFRMQWIK
jgi:4-hydroxybenzoate polyprenyltransferase